MKIAVCFFLIFFNLSAQNISGELTIDSERKISIGDSFKAVIVINSPDVGPFSLDSKKKWSEHFEFISIIDQGVSSKLTSAYEINVLTVYKSPLENVNITIPWKNQNISIRIASPDLLAAEVVEIPQDFLVIEQDAWSKFWTKNRIKIVLILLVIVVFVVFVSVNPIKKHFLKKKHERERQRLALYWSEKIKSAQCRDDYEYLYQKRKTWLDLFDLEMNAQKFFKELNEIQYQPNWSSAQLDKIVQEHKKLVEKIGV